MVSDQASVNGLNGCTAALNPALPGFQGEHVILLVKAFFAEIGMNQHPPLVGYVSYHLYIEKVGFANGTKISPNMKGKLQETPLKVSGMPPLFLSP